MNSLRSLADALASTGTVASRNTPRVLLAGAIAIALSGCVFGPKYQRPEVPVPQTWRAPAGEAANVVNAAWWEGFHDPDLDALIKQSIDANKDLLQATERVKEFEAKLKITGADKYPQLQYNASAEREHYSVERPQTLGILTKPTQNAFEVGTGINWEFDIWGKMRRANEASLADLLSSEYARHAVMLTVVNNVATSYFELLALDHHLRLAKQTLKNRADALKLINTRYKGGSSSKMAVLQAKSAVDEVWVTIPDLERQIATLENALSLLAGRNPGEIVRHTVDDEPALPAVPGGVPSDVLSRRPDVLEAEQSLIAANARIGVAKAAFFPSISLTGLLGFASSELDTLTKSDAGQASIGVGLLGPIFSGGKLSGQVHEAEAYERELLIKYRQTVQAALGDVDDALVFNAKAAEGALRGDKQVQTLADLVKLAQVRYDGGQSDYLEVLTAERDLYKAQAEQVDRHRDSYLALISVYAAMGGGWMVEQDKLRTGAPQTTQAVTPSQAITAATSKPISAPAEPADASAKVQPTPTNSQEHPQ
ncbi:MAG: efflux transporter outer membrane subunit [Rhodanobacteraceae bacterium]